MATGDEREERKVDGEKKLERFKLAQKIHDCNGKIDLKSEEISLLKKLIGKQFPTLYVGQAYQGLDPDSKIPEEGGEKK